MKAIRVVLGLAVIAGLVSCSPVSVKTDYDREANFSNLKTFDWRAHPQNSTNNPLLKNTLLEKRVQSAVKRELSDRGWATGAVGEPEKAQEKIDQAVRKFWRGFRHSNEANG